MASDSDMTVQRRPSEERKPMRPSWIAACLAALLLLSACSWDEIRGTASRTARNACANAPNCTVYEGGEAVGKDTLDPWDTRR